MTAPTLCVYGVWYDTRRCPLATISTIKYCLQALTVNDLLEPFGSINICCCEASGSSYMSDVDVVLHNVTHDL